MAIGRDDPVTKYVRGDQTLTRASEQATRTVASETDRMMRFYTAFRVKNGRTLLDAPTLAVD